jgi:2-iminobutanoate/2-iminopropanoate deaminase
MKKIITTTNAPAPIGTIQPGNLKLMECFIRAGDSYYPCNWRTFKGSIEEETELDGKYMILTEAGMTLKMSKTSIFISDMENCKLIRFYATYFNEAMAPAGETVEVANPSKYVKCRN